MKLPTEAIVWSMVLKVIVKFDSRKPSAISLKLFDVAKLNKICRKVKVGPGARESRIRKARQPQKSIENVDECFSGLNYSGNTCTSTPGETQTSRFGEKNAKIMPGNL